MLALLLVLANAQSPIPRHDPVADDTSKRLAEVRAEILSNGPEVAAWGARHAREEELASLTAALAERARGWRRDPWSDAERFALRAVLDALLYLDGRLPTAELVAIAERYADLHPELVLLAARDARANTALFERVISCGDGGEWLAAVDVLATTAPERLAPKLVALTKITVHVDVHDASAPPAELSSIVSCYDGREPAPAGFPPLSIYDLNPRIRPASDTDPDASNVLARGPFPTTWKRTESNELVLARCEHEDVLLAPNESPSHAMRPRTPRTTDEKHTNHALEALRWITGDRAENATAASTAKHPRRLAADIFVDRAWSDAATYLARTSAELDALRGAWSDLLGALRAHGAIAEAALTTPAPIAIEVRDRRSDRSVPLPDLTARR